MKKTKTLEEKQREARERNFAARGITSVPDSFESDSRSQLPLGKPPDSESQNWRCWREWETVDNMTLAQILRCSRDHARHVIEDHPGHILVPGRCKERFRRVLPVKYVMEMMGEVRSELSNNKNKA